MLKNLKFFDKKVSSPLNVQGCLDFYVYEYEMRNITATLSKDNFVLHKKRKKNDGLIFDIFRFEPAGVILLQTFKDVLSISTTYLPTESDEF